ncbi:MAG: GtrA family protein [Parvibaculales bacterium]
MSGGRMQFRRFNSSETRTQFYRFLLIGGINTVFGYCVFVICLVGGGFSKDMSLVATYVLGMTFNFFSIGHGVFANLRMKAVLPFIFIYITVFAINLGLLECFVTSGVHELLAQAVLVLPMALISFAGFKLIFAKP